MELPESLCNYNNYYKFEQLARTGQQTIFVKDITSDNWIGYRDGILNVMRDCIETEWAHNVKIQYQFNNGVSVGLTIPDTFFNIVMWYMVIATGRTIEPKHIFFPKNISKGYIKNWIDRYFIDEVRLLYENKVINNIIDDALYSFVYINDFALYLCNTINLEDFVELMNKSERFYDALHPDMSNVSLEDAKDIGMMYTNIAVEEIDNAKDKLGFDHCLADSLRTGEGTNIKQLKEVINSIGAKPNGAGGVHPYIVKNSFINGGLQSAGDFFTESSAGRLAQTIEKSNIGNSGHLSRIMGLNNTDTFIYPNPRYDCHSYNYEEILVKSEKHLTLLRDRYYKTHPAGMMFKITEKDKQLIGKKIYLRSPITCASAANGEGICYICYGDLAYTIRDINCGKAAAEMITSILTQTQLSAKHILDVIIAKLNWGDTPFKEWFDNDLNFIKLSDDEYEKNQFLVIDPDDITLEESDMAGDTDDENVFSEKYNEYITNVVIMDGSNEINIHTTDYTNLYISHELNNIIRNRKKTKIIDGKIVIPLESLVEMPLFYIEVQNNELSRTLNRFRHILNKKEVTTSMDRNQILQELLDTSIEGGLGVMSVHLEVILSNQIRSAHDILERPDWRNNNEPYQILTLDKALFDNPSVTISLMYEKIHKALYYPLTFKKQGTSFMDMMFMIHPMKYDKSPSEASEQPIQNNDTRKRAVTFE